MKSGRAGQPDAEVDRWCRWKAGRVVQRFYLYFKTVINSLLVCEKSLVLLGTPAEPD